jgi:hypothetical protein
VLLKSVSKMYFMKYQGFYECHCRAVGYMYISGTSDMRTAADGWRRTLNTGQFK